MRMANQNLKGKRVVLGLSGGVDSAVAAILLLDEGAEVHALHMTNWEDDDAYCTAAEDLQDARKVCERLNIPFHSVNFAKEYRDEVFEYFLDGYRAGRTPNPDVLCNRKIKFGVFRAYAHRLGGEFIATGHYARTSLLDNHTALLKAADRSKDQSYFLHAVSEEALVDTLFPLGELHKNKVRRIAREYGLDVYDKKDSTGICFIGERPFREFLATYISGTPGEIQTPDGAIVGEHHGLMYYTQGQRQGLGIGGRKNSENTPWYVVGKNVDRNVLIVVQGNHSLRYSEGLIGSAARWVNGIPAALEKNESFDCAVKIRYRQSDQACRISCNGDALRVDFEAAQADVTPGQFAVFYNDERCLGGAVIEHGFRHGEALPKTI